MNSVKTIAEIKATLELRKDRSAWDKGVTAYALELLEDVSEALAYEGRESLNSVAEIGTIALGGARNWEDYSWGGCALIYDGDIAERLCSPSELKKTRSGERSPNSRESWLDCQARALCQACNRLKKAARE